MSYLCRERSEASVLGIPEGTEEVEGGAAGGAGEQVVTPWDVQGAVVDGKAVR